MINASGNKCDMRWWNEWCELMVRTSGGRSDRDRRRDHTQKINSTQLNLIGCCQNAAMHTSSNKQTGLKSS